MSKLLGGILAALLCTCSFCSAQELTVAAASDLQFVLPEITARFQKTTGHSVKVDLWILRQFLRADSERRAQNCNTNGKENARSYPGCTTPCFTSALICS